jgi:hypothetical protein
MSRTNPTLISQISKKHRDVVHSIYEHRGGNLSRDEFLHRTKEKWMTEPGCMYNTTQYVANRSQTKTLYGCTDDEAEAMVVADIYNSNLPDRGVARRIINEDPDELESALSLSARLDWIDTCYPSQWGESYPDVWIALRGLAAGDIEVAQAIVRARRNDSRGGHKPTVLIYDAVEAIVMMNQKAQKRLAPRIASCSVADQSRAMLETLHGIIKADSSIVAKGLERVLATFRRGEPFDYEMIISLHAHGLAELAHWVSPKLLEKFDVDRPLPWDRGYYHWLRRQPRSTAYRDLSAYSRLLSHWVYNLDEPDWWRRKRESAGEEEPTSGSHSISEEAGAEESEGVPLPADGAPALLMFRHAVPGRRKRAFDAVELVDIGRTRSHGYGPDDAEGIFPWLSSSGWQSKMPWLILARFQGESWIHCIASRAGLVPVERLASNKDLQVLTTSFDPQENRTRALLYKSGSIAAELATSGKGEDPLEVLSFKSSVKTKAFLKRCKTVRQAIDGFFAEFDAKARDLIVTESDGLLKLRGPDGRAISAGELHEVGIRYYTPLTALENPAGERLYRAIVTGDVEAARQAIADGASLEFVPDRGRSPLMTAFDDGHPGDWRGVAKLLIEAGAPIDGYDWEDVLICSPINMGGRNQEGAIIRMQAMLSLGASIHSLGRFPKFGYTPLHLAILNGYPRVVQFLLDQGADLEARNADGQTALELAEWMARDDLERESDGRAVGEAARREIQIVRLLRDVYERHDRANKAGRVK